MSSNPLSATVQGWDVSYQRTKSGWIVLLKKGSTKIRITTKRENVEKVLDEVSNAAGIYS